jgi:predicted porin
VPVGAIDLAATYNNTKTENAAGAETSNVKGYQIGAKYNLSKRSQLYVVRLHEDDSKAAAASLVNKTRTMVGMNHSF